MRLPDFLIIGAARCGTTSLYEALRQHPGIFLPANKRPEPHFFMKETEYQKGLQYYSEKYFTGIANDLCAGESSTSYLYQPYVAERIKEHLPDVKLIVLLRNPMERAFSNYMVSFKNKIETLTFNEAIHREKERLDHPENNFETEIRPFSYIDRGRYYSQLQQYLNFFAKEQIHIILFEDLTEKTAEVLKQTFSFLTVDANFTSQQVNTALNKSDYGQTNMSDEDRAFIYQELKEEIDNLSQFLNRDLSVWKQGGTCVR